MMEGYRHFMLGDMLVLGTPRPKLLKALAHIADGLHPGFDLSSAIIPGKSKDSCVLCALTVRDFLRQIDIDARERSVSVVMGAQRGGETLHSLGIGVEDNPDKPDEGRWNGHLVVMAENYLIETTLHHVRRPAWPDLPNMIAVPECEPGDEVMGKPVIAQLHIADDEPPGDYQFSSYWIDFPKNRGWRRGPDATDIKRRLPVVRRLVEGFRVSWREAA